MIDIPYMSVQDGGLLLGLDAGVISQTKGAEGRLASDPLSRRWHYIENGSVPADDIMDRTRETTKTSGYNNAFDFRCLDLITRSGS